MRQLRDTSTSGYSIIASVLLISFLIVLVSGTLHLIISEMKDGQGRQDYLKAFYAAEGGLEMALYDIKEKGYGYATPGNYSFTGAETADASLSYEFESAVKAFTGGLLPGDTEIIPLFTIDDSGIQSIDNLDFNSEGDLLSWNIIGTESGLSGTGGFDSSTSIQEKTIGAASSNTNIESFLSSNTGAYLMLVNMDNADVNYTLTSNDYFTLPVAKILSQGIRGRYQQNLETSIDNTEFLGILRYSIYSDF